MVDPTVEAGESEVLVMINYRIRVLRDDDR